MDKLRINELTEKVDELESKIFFLERELKKLTNPEPVLIPLKVGDKVRGSSTCGFDASMTGKVVFIEPKGTVWVLRDRASSPVMYDRSELVLT